jgi:uncharacterized membrane protein YbaN (DUF454 family)
MRLMYLVAGIIAVGFGVVGIFLPLLPTVPFMLAAAFCFARSNPEWERRLLDDPQIGPPMRAWRERGAISRRGKAAALVALAIGSIAGLAFLDAPLRFVPTAVALVCAAWIVTRKTD